MIHLVRYYLLCKCEVLILDVQYMCKSQVQCYTCHLNAEVGVGREGRTLRDHWSVILAQQVSSRFRERPCLKKIWRVVEEDMLRHIHPYTQIYIHQVYIQ